MIYWTFKSVQEEYEYAQKQFHGMMETAERYIKAVLHEVGTIELTVDNKPTVISLKGGRYDNDQYVVFYQNVSKPKMLWEFQPQEMLDICQEIRNLHLVEEEGDTEKEA